MMNKNKPRIGIALGSGSARGWAHIGVLKQLGNMGIQPDIICGCSIGSIVGAAYAVNNLEKLEKWATGLSKLEMMRYFELKASLNGFVNQQKLRQCFHDNVCAEQQSIEGLKKQFATVATDLDSGREIWLNKGRIIDAVWASIALPGLFPPMVHQAHEDRWLVDGGLVNPVPVSVCRAMGADIVIAVNLNGNVLNSLKRKKIPTPKPVEPNITETLKQDSEADPENSQNSLVDNVAASLKEYSDSLFSNNKNNNPMPGVIDAAVGSIYIMQDKITRSRMVGDPPEILLNPRVGNLGLLEFYRAEEAIEEGQQCVLRIQSEIEHIMAE